MKLLNFLFLGCCSSIGLYGCLQGDDPSSGGHLIATPLPRAIEIRAHIDSLDKKVKVENKKAIN